MDRRWPPEFESSVVGNVYVHRGLSVNFMALRSAELVFTYLLVTAILAYLILNGSMFKSRHVNYLHSIIEGLPGTQDSAVACGCVRKRIRDCWCIVSSGVDFIIHFFPLGHQICTAAIAEQ